MPEQGTAYQPDEYVLAYHGPLLFDALIRIAVNWTEQNTLLGSTGPHYFIHIRSWKTSWDEWVPESRIVKYNEENKQLGRRLLHAQTTKAGIDFDLPGSEAGKGSENGSGNGKGNAKMNGANPMNANGSGSGGAAAGNAGVRTSAGTIQANGQKGKETGLGKDKDNDRGKEKEQNKATGSAGSVNGTAGPSTGGNTAAGQDGAREGDGNEGGMDIDDDGDGNGNGNGAQEASEPPEPTTASSRQRPVRATKATTSTALSGNGTGAGSSKSGSGAGSTGAGTSTNAAAGPSKSTGTANGSTAKGKDKEGAGGAGATQISGSGVDRVAGKKRAREAALEAELAASARRPEVKIVIPDVLKLQLVDDWENVTKHNQLVTLPRTPHVRQLLSQYKQYVEDTKQDRSARSTSLLNEIISGITLYFDKALGNNLLYRFERAQYVEQTRRYGGGPTGAAAASAAAAAGQGVGAGAGAGERSPNEGEVRKRAASEIYGAEHLLRLFVNFGPFISYTNIDSESLNILRESINDIMKWMIKEQKRLFIKEYETTSMQYQTLSRT